MSVVSTSGEKGPPLFIFKCKRLPYWEIVVDGPIEVQRYAFYIPQSSCLASREESGGVDWCSFNNWALKFLDPVSNLTSNCRHISLPYDGYGAHLPLRALKLFKRDRIVVYALPAHTIGKTQPLDVVSFSVFKRELNKNILKMLKLGNQQKFDIY